MKVIRYRWEWLGAVLGAMLGDMLLAVRGKADLSYDILADDQVVTHVATKWLRGGTFILADGAYAISDDGWGTAFTVTDPSGTQLATASDPSRRAWTVTTGSQTYAFDRRSRWRQHMDLVAGGQAIGYIRRPNLNAEATADLPTMPLTMQVFALALALLVWDSGSLLARPR